MKKKLLILITLLCIGNANAQIPDDTNGRLYRLCKAWGYFKYSSQYQCTVEWDTLLNTAVNEVLLAPDNTAFNNALTNMFNNVGNNFYYSSPPGPLPDTNINYDNSWIADVNFSQPARDFLDTLTLYTYAMDYNCLVNFNDYSDPNYYSYIDFRNDTIAMPIDYTDEANRLTVMFYYWNVINYFFPYKSIMDQSWDSTLWHFIPLFRQAANEFEFNKTFLKLVTKINDTHGKVESPALSAGFWGGDYYPDIYFYRIDTNCVVKKVGNVPGVAPGDILTAVNGIPIHDITDSLTAYTPASTTTALYRDIYLKMTRGALSSAVSLTLLDVNSIPYTVNAIRSLDQNGFWAWIYDNGTTSSYYITQCGYGYVDMNLLQSADVNAMYAALHNAPAIIFDLRNYPNGTLWDIGPKFFPGPFISALYNDPALVYPPSYFSFPGWYYKGNDYYNLGTWLNGAPYSGKVYILVNNETQSQAEYTCQYMSYHPNAKVIGNQTTGADGNISYVSLPGSILSRFTSMGWYYADGYQQQRHGVKMDTLVYPTIAGIRQGRDELLDAALDCLTGMNNVQAEQHQISIFPNPTNGEINIHIADAGNKNIRISVEDLTGRIIIQKDLGEHPVPFSAILDLSFLSKGIYILKTENGLWHQSDKIIVH